MSNEQATQPEEQQAPQKSSSLVRATPMSNGMTFTPQSFGELMEWAKIVSQSGMVPKSYTGNPGAVLVAVQMGAEIGLSPMASLQNIAVINGRPSLWGDAILAVIKTHPEFVEIVETLDPETATATCKISRRGQPDVVHTFSMDDAKRAGLLGKDGPWQTNPKRMCQMRARGFAARDQFPDALRGIYSAEEAQDIKQAEEKPAAPRAKSLGDIMHNAKPIAAPVLRGTTIEKGDEVKA